MKKRKKLRVGRLLVLAACTAFAAGFAVFGVQKAFGHFRNDSASNHKTVQSDVTSEKVASDHSTQINQIKDSIAMSSVSVLGYNDEEIRSLFYSVPIDEALQSRMEGVTFISGTDFIDYEDLRYVRVLFHDFSDQTLIGELVVNASISDDIENIFYELYQGGYQFEKMILPEAYGGDDNASMSDNNTSAFSFRLSDGNGILEHEHSLGLAIDINPYYNPQVILQDEATYVYPPVSQSYADRTNMQPHMIDENDLAYQIFTKYGFEWGGTYGDRADYQHFEKWDHISRSSLYSLSDYLQSDSASSQDEFDDAASDDEDYEVSDWQEEGWIESQEDWYEDWQEEE